MKQGIKKALDFKLKNKQDKTMFYMSFSILGNVFMSIIKLILATMTLSIWFFVNAGFNIVLGLSRYFSIRDYIKMRHEENPKVKLEIGYNNYMNNGIMLIILGIIYILISIYMIFNHSSSDYQGLVVYIVATISFCSLGIAIYGALKYKKETDPIINGAKITNNANALTNIVLTQVVLLAEFGENIDNTLYNGGTAMAMSIIIILLGIFMLVGMKKYLKGSDI